MYNKILPFIKLILYFVKTSIAWLMQVAKITE